MSLRSALFSIFLASCTRVSTESECLGDGTPSRLMCAPPILLCRKIHRYKDTTLYSGNTNGFGIQVRADVTSGGAISKGRGSAGVGRLPAERDESRIILEVRARIRRQCIIDQSAICCFGYFHRRRRLDELRADFSPGVTSSR